MSFANKGRDSSDTRKLRAEYQKKAVEARESKDPATVARLKDEKAKAFERVRDQIVHERRETLASHHKVLISMGKLKSPEQMQDEKAKAAAGAGGKVGAGR